MAVNNCLHLAPFGLPQICCGFYASIMLSFPRPKAKMYQYYCMPVYKRLIPR